MPRGGGRGGNAQELTDPLLYVWSTNPPPPNPQPPSSCLHPVKNVSLISLSDKFVTWCLLCWLLGRVLGCGRFPFFADAPQLGQRLPERRLLGLLRLQRLGGPGGQEALPPELSPAPTPRSRPLCIRHLRAPIRLGGLRWFLGGGAGGRGLLGGFSGGTGGGSGGV